jgi:hypothetical protein
MILHVHHVVRSWSWSAAAVVGRRRMRRGGCVAQQDGRQVCVCATPDNVQAGVCARRARAPRIGPQPSEAIDCCRCCRRRRGRCNLSELLRIRDDERRRRASFAQVDCAPRTQLASDLPQAGTPPRSHITTTCAQAGAIGRAGAAAAPSSSCSSSGQILIWLRQRVCELGRRRVLVATLAALMRRRLRNSSYNNSTDNWPSPDGRQQAPDKRFVLLVDRHVNLGPCAPATGQLALRNAS